MVKKTKEIFYDDIEKETILNEDYRRVIYTVPGSIQLVYMSLLPGEDIPFEIHHNISQFIRIEAGKGLVEIKYSENEIKRYKLKNGSALVIPHGLYHRISNTSKIEDLKLYTLYTPPEHSSDKIQKQF